MRILKKLSSRIFKENTYYKYYQLGKRFTNDSHVVLGSKATEIEESKGASRTEIINYLVSFLNRETHYLEIGVRNPNHNFNLIKANCKFSVDPGVEFLDNPVDFKMTSDEFFNSLRNGEILKRTIKFDVIFIDGLHLADQVDRDIRNALDFIRDDGFIVLHDCNPPSEWHARENFYFEFTPARKKWNGTTWKAFSRFRQQKDIYSCCIDSDYGVGILSKSQKIGTPTTLKNDYFEYDFLNEHRQELLNLVDFKEFQRLMSSKI